MTSGSLTARSLKDVYMLHAAGVSGEKLQEVWRSKRVRNEVAGGDFNNRCLTRSPSSALLPLFWGRVPLLK